MVELFVSATQTGRVNFQSIPQLRNQANQIILIKNIEVFPDVAYEASQYDSTIPGVASADLAKAVLVLYVNGEESVHMLPLPKLVNLDLHSTGEANALAETSFADLSNVDFDKSYVQLSGNVSQDCIIPLGITYLRFQRDPTGKFTEA